MEDWFDGAPDSYDGSSPGHIYDDLLLSAESDVIGRTVPLSITFVQRTVL